MQSNATSGAEWHVQTAPPDAYHCFTVLACANRDSSHVGLWLSHLLTHISIILRQIWRSPPAANLFEGNTGVLSARNFSIGEVLSRTTEG